jgi:hypothetical protein
LNFTGTIPTPFIQGAYALADPLGTAAKGILGGLS